MFSGDENARCIKFYMDHAKAIRKAGLAPPVFPTMGYLWINQDEKVDIEK